MKTAKLAKSYRIDDGKHFRLKDFDPATPGTYSQSKKPRSNCKKTLRAWRNCNPSSMPRTAGHCC